MMSSFTLSPSFAMASFHKPTRIRKSTETTTWTNIVFFATALLSLFLVVSHPQHGGSLFHSSDGTSINSFLGAPTVVSAAMATTAVSTVISPRAISVSAHRRPNMMAMSAAGSSRTLIEVGPSEPEEECDLEYNCEYQIDVTYLDEDFEQGLLILRRANLPEAKATAEPMPAAQHHRPNPILQKAVQTIRNPIVALVIAGNVAAMTGLMPMGIAGFFPALGVVLGGKLKWPALIAKQCTKVSGGLAFFSKLRFKFVKLVSKVYKNRSRYSLLSDYFWYVQTGDGDQTTKGASKA